MFVDGDTPLRPEPQVSVVIPTRDRPELVARAVATALAQEGVALEVIVVDDGSVPPASPPQLGDPRVRVLRHARSLGVAAARNAGIGAARSEWVAFLDDDDLWAPAKLAAQLAAMREAGSSWSFTGCVFLDGELQAQGGTAPPLREVSLAAMRHGNRIGTPSSAVVARELLERAGAFDPAFSIMADWDLWLRLTAIVPPLELEERLTGYVRHEASMHRQSSRAIVQEFRRLRRVHGRVGGARVWKWLAETRHRSGHGALSSSLLLLPALASPRSLWIERAELMASVRRRVRGGEAFVHRTAEIPEGPGVSIREHDSRR